MASKPLLLLIGLVATLVLAPLAPATHASGDRVDPRLLDEIAKGAPDVRVIVMTDGPAHVVAPSAEALGARVSYVYDLIDAFAATIPANVLERLALLDGVSYVWQDAVVRANIATSRVDIGVPTVEAQGWTGSGVRVAVIDTGINPLAASMGGFNAQAPGFANKVAICREFLLGVNLPNCNDDNGHGTHTASTVGSSYTVQLGMAKGVSFAIYKVLDATGSGFVSDGVAALNHIVANKATNQIRVISMSLGTGGGAGNGPFSVAADAAWNAGFVVVASAGNAGPGAQTIGSPADGHKVIAVGAVFENSRFSNTDDVLTGFSSRGPTSDGRIKPEIVAPGANIQANCIPATLSCTYSGTSMSAPHVAGVAALVLEKHPTWTPDDVRNALLSTAIKQTADTLPTPNNNYGYGLLWAPGALSL